MQIPLQISASGVPYLAIYTNDVFELECENEFFTFQRYEGPGKSDECGVQRKGRGSGDRQHAQEGTDAEHGAETGEDEGAFDGDVARAVGDMDLCSIGLEPWSPVRILSLNSSNRNILTIIRKPLYR